MANSACGRLRKRLWDDHGVRMDIKVLDERAVELTALLFFAGRSGLVSASDCAVRGPRFESHRGQLCLSRQPLRYTALGTGCAP